MKQLRCITINTDASFHPVHGVGGYAFYIVCDLFKIQKAGMFKVSPNNAQEAELMCMANALHTLLNTKELPSTKLIVINSDALYSFEKIGLKKQGVGKVVAQFLKQVRHKMQNGNTLPSFDIRHVKAHVEIKDARSWVNDWCDKEAKKWMREAVKTKQISKTNK